MHPLAKDSEIEDLLGFRENDTVIQPLLLALHVSPLLLFGQPPCSCNNRTSFSSLFAVSHDDYNLLTNV